MLIDGGGQAEDQCRDYDRFLEQNEIDILVLGIGNNGHIGFNEPSHVFTAKTHVVELEEETIKQIPAFSAEDEVPKKAVTMGMAGITGAGKVVLIAAGVANGRHRKITCR